MAAALDYLADFGGDTWQARWDASPLAYVSAEGPDPAGPRPDASAATGFRALFCLRVVQPTLEAFRRSGFLAYAPFFIEAQRDPLLDKFAEHVAAYEVAFTHRRQALLDMACLLTVQGVGLADVTPAALLHHAHETRRVRAASLPPASKLANQFVGQVAWSVLHLMGQFPAGTPTTLRAAMLRGQLSVEQMVDRYQITNRSVRALLIDYLQRRAVDTDYSSLSALVLALAHHFWERIEAINPGQADLRIAPDVYSAWRDSIRFRADGKPRGNQDDIVIGVRSFYYDLHTWAAHEPGRWGPWVAPCPVPPGELRGLGKRRRRINDRSADRTRQRQPLLPILVKHVEDRYDQTRALLERARGAAIDETFVLDGRTYRRVVTNSTLRKHRYELDAVPVRVIDEASGTAIAVEHDEDDAFWDWACIETLRHTGVRIEELCELTHLSVRHYQRANGEVIALLVIAPSKTDRERVIPMSAELFHVIASILRRHTSNGTTVPLLSRFDGHEKVWSAPMPFLFQRRRGAGRSVISPAFVLNRLKRIGAGLAAQHPAFATTAFTPHDFRRIFATELVNSGLPIHIGAALLGHLDVQTTRGYVAVFNEDVVRHYVAFLDQRRRQRPADEYRDVTTDEWDEFDEHFDKRKVELGACGRPYGTPCQHEHACVRCPMLHVNPKMLGRLDELEADLVARRQRAETEGWTGEVDGIDLTLTFLRSKRDDTQRRLRRPAAGLTIKRLSDGVDDEEGSR